MSERTLALLKKYGFPLSGEEFPESVERYRIER